MSRTADRRGTRPVGHPATRAAGRPAGRPTGRRPDPRSPPDPDRPSGGAGASCQGHRRTHAAMARRVLADLRSCFPSSSGTAQSFLVQQSEITTSCGIGRTRRYLVGGGRVNRPGGGAAASTRSGACLNRSRACLSLCVRNAALSAGRSRRTEESPMSQRPGRPRNAQQKLAEIRRQQRSRQNRLRALVGVAVLAAIALVVLAVISFAGGRTAAPVAQPVRGMATGATVDGIACQTSEQVAYHIHSHLTIYASGVRQVVTAGIGIPGPQQVVNGFVEGGKCLYWLHTHDTTGIIHVESPAQRVYTLGQFFDVWGQPLSNTQAGRATGHVTAFVNGKRFAGDPRSIKLTPHAVIQLDVGKIVPPQPFTFQAGL